jgi:hypothetical protein
MGFFVVYGLLFRTFVEQTGSAHSVLNYFLGKKGVCTMSEHYDDIILEGDNKQVWLSSRITQKEHKMLDEIRGWLQTQRNLSTVRKQEVVMYVIQTAYENLMSTIREIDQTHKMQTPQNVHKDTPEVHEKPTAEIVEFPNPKPPEQAEYIPFQNYDQFANKSYNTFSPKPNKHTATVPEKNAILKGLGL